MRAKVILLAALVAASACAGAKASDPLVRKLEQLAERGSGEAQYYLGMAYWVGEGVAKDQGKAVAYFRQAAASGDPLGAYKLGCLYDGQYGLLTRDPTKALEYKSIAANAGYALAQQDVAALYAERSDFGAALQWIKRAAAQGTAGALSTYASVYNGAPGITPDPVITAAYFRLYLDRVGGDEKQRAWLAAFEQKLMPQQRDQARTIVATYRPAPTPLTLKALSGVRAAKELVDRR
jgi:hypothetical protein